MSRSLRHKFEDVLQILNKNEISDLLGRVKHAEAQEEAEKKRTRWRTTARKVRKKQDPEMEKSDADGDVTKLEVSPNILQTLHDIEMAKTRREQDDTQTKLAKIHTRVKAALVHFGINPNLEMSQTQIMAEVTLKNRPPGYTTKERRERILHQRSVIDHIHEYNQVCIRRNALMDEVVFWMCETVDAIEKDMKAEVELAQTEKEEKEVHRAIRNAILTAESSAKKIKRLGQTIFTEVLQAIGADEEEESAAATSDSPYKLLSLLASRRQGQRQKSISDGEEVKDESQLLGDADNWKAASQDVKQALNEMVKTARNANIKNTAKNAQKQFNFICIAIERRNKEAAQFGQEMLDCQLKINQLSKANERLQNERDRMKMSLDDYDMRMNRMKQRVEELEQKKKELQEYIDALEDGGMWKRPSTVSVPPTPDIGEEEDEGADEQARLQHENEALKQMVQDLRKENKQVKEKLTKLSMQISKLQNGLMLTKENAKHLERQVELLRGEKTDKETRQESVIGEHKKAMKEVKETIEKLERDNALLKTEIKGKDEAIQFQEMRLKEVAQQSQSMTKKSRKMSVFGKVKPPMEEITEDPNYKQAVNRMKSDYEAELSRLKEHVLKEKQRCEATLRRQDHELNNRLQGIHKECIHLLRAINRFKESMSVIFDREGLLDLAHEMRTTLKDLPTEEPALPQDTRSMLSTVSGLATELMVALEFKVSQAMINKRIELKETQLMKKFSGEEQTDAEGEKEKEKMTRIKHQNEQLTDKLNKAKDEIMSVENLLSETRRIHEEKYQSLLERYKNIIISNNAAQRELTTVRKDFSDEIKKRDVMLHDMRQTMTQAGYTHEQALKKLKIDLRQAKSRLVQSRMTLVSRQEPETVRFNLANQKKNLELLEEALLGEKISEDMHMITMEVIKRSMDIPIIRLRNLFERYVQFRKFKDNRDKLRKQLNQTTGAEHWELRQFIENMEKKMTEANQRWRDRADKVKQERTKLYEQMRAIFEAVHEESGILLVKPIIVYATKKSGEIVSGSGRRSSVAMQVYSKGVHSELQSPTALVGTQVNLIGDRGPLWKMPTIQEGDDTVVTTPRMLDMDINKERRRAKQTFGPVGRFGMGDTRGTVNLPPLATFIVTQSPHHSIPHEDDDDDEDMVGW